MKQPDLVLSPETAKSLLGVAAAPGQSYIFSGPAGIGKTSAALVLALQMLCPEAGCGECQACRLVAARSHPDLILISPDGSSIGIAQVKEMVQAVSLRPANSTAHRLVIIDEADTMTVEAQNALLKTLEEPPPGTMIVLSAAHPERLLATIRSRSYAIIFTPVSASVIATTLTEKFGMPPGDAAGLAELASGCPGRAITIVGDEASRQEFASARALATELLDASRYGRLRMAAELAKAACSPAVFELITLHTRKAVREMAVSGEAPSAAYRRLQALTTFARHQAANVSAKTAWEGLALGIE